MQSKKITIDDVEYYLVPTTISRFEYISNERDLVKRDVNLEFSVQDEGKTLKIFEKKINQTDESVQKRVKCKTITSTKSKNKSFF